MAIANMTENAPTKDPEYGQRLLTAVIDAKAKTNPDQPWMYVPRSASPSDGWKPVTFSQAAKGINRVAHKIHDTLGAPEPGAAPVIAYIGPNDVRYPIMVLAAAKAGYAALLISTRNSMEAQLNLFEKTNCQSLAFDAGFSRVVQPWLQERDMRVFTVSDVDAWLPEEDVPDFHYEKSFKEAEWDPLVVLHTSGSTGLPKPITARHGMMAIADRSHYLPELDGNQSWFHAITSKAKRLFIPMPAFHAAGLYVMLMLSIYWEMPVALGIGSRPLSTDLALECLEYAGCDAAILPPALLEEISQTPKDIAALARLSYVIFGGGNLGTDAGNRLIDAGVTVVNLISATEFAPFPYYWQPNKKLWRYFIINSDIFGCDWRKTGEDDVYEQVIVRYEKEPHWQGFFYTFPNDQEYHTHDLYRPHPTEPNHWIYHGRADDIIVFSNGEKLNPVSIEEMVGDHPQLKGVLVVGSNRFQPAIILEPTETPKNEDEANKLIDDVWPWIVKANKETVAHGQIGRNLVTLSNPEKPFSRAGKGTIQRAATVKLYKDEIDAIYQQVESAPAERVVKLDLESQDGLTESIIDLFHESVEDPRLDPHADFFAAGVDSMRVINASRLLRSGLEAAGVHVDASNVATRVIYGNPTPAKLAKYIFSLVHGHINGLESHHKQAMSALLEKYTSGLPRADPNKPAPVYNGQTILITGTTGALGSYLLHFALASPNVKKVICLNRSENGRARQEQALLDRGLPTDLTNAEFLHADLSRANLGLKKDDYARLLQEVDRVIHNQWPVNFNIPVESFEPHIRGVRNLVEFSVEAAKRVAIIFMSSIGTVDMWTNPEAVPEKSISDFDLTSNGYGQGKLVSSLVLEKAAEVAGIPTTVVRVGQIAGPRSREGYWNRQEWFPSLIASSVYLGMLPNSLGPLAPVDFTVIEDMANIVLELSGVTSEQSSEVKATYYHGVNPSMAPWADLASAVQSFYQGRIKKVVSLEEWVEALEKSQATTEDLNKNPGVKLLDTYKGLAAREKAGVQHTLLSMERTKEKSKTAREMGAITPELMENWCRQWQF